MIICSCLTSKISNYPSSLSKPKEKCCLCFTHTKSATVWPPRSAAAWLSLICRHRLICILPSPDLVFQLSLSPFLSLWDCVYSVLICYFIEFVWVNHRVCGVIFWFLLLSFESWTKCVGAMWLRTVTMLWYLLLSNSTSQLEFWVYNKSDSVCVGVWGLMGYRTYSVLLLFNFEFLYCCSVAVSVGIDLI